MCAFRIVRLIPLDISFSFPLIPPESACELPYPDKVYRQGGQAHVKKLVPIIRFLIL